MRLTKRSNSNNWFLEVRIDGKSYVRSTKTDHKPTANKIAESLVRSLRIEAARGPTNDISLSDAIDRFVASHLQSRSYKGLISLRRVLLKRIDGSLLLSNISGQHLSDLVALRRAEGCKPQTVKHSLSFITRVMNYARRDGFSVVNVSAPKVPIKSDRLRYLSLNEETRLLKELDPNRKASGIPETDKRPLFILKAVQDNYDLVVMLLDTGARYGEIASVEWEQIDLENRLIKLWRFKVSNESVIYMTTRVIGVLTRRFNAKAGSQYVFTNRAGGPRGNANNAIRKAIRRAGLKDVTIHTLRRTHASRLIQNGLSIYEVRSVLGHTDIKTTMRYAHLENVDVTQKARDVIERLNEQILNEPT